MSWESPKVPNISQFPDCHCHENGFKLCPYLFLLWSLSPEWAIGMLISKSVWEHNRLLRGFNLFNILPLIVFAILWLLRTHLQQGQQYRKPATQNREPPKGWRCAFQRRFTWDWNKTFLFPPPNTYLFYLSCQTQQQAESWMQLCVLEKQKKLFELKQAIAVTRSVIINSAIKKRVLTCKQPEKLYESIFLIYSSYSPRVQTFPIFQCWCYYANGACITSCSDGAVIEGH